MDDPKHGAYSRYESLGQASHPDSGDTMLLGQDDWPKNYRGNKKDEVVF